MLVLSRKIGERITIGDGVVVTIVKVQGNRVQMGIEAPADVRIHREEVVTRPHCMPMDIGTSNRCAG